jgi:hypothetical protein
MHPNAPNHIDKSQASQAAEEDTAAAQASESSYAHRASESSYAQALHTYQEALRYANLARNVRNEPCVRALCWVKESHQHAKRVLLY